jgi:aryl-alcohol dehydrogenase-like predicted oxidoreductase
MDQVRLGATGLYVSRVCLGMMSYGNDSDRSWVLDEAAAEPIVRRAGFAKVSASPSGTAGRRSSRCGTTTTVYREEKREMIRLCLDEGAGVIPGSPGERHLRGRGEEAARQAHPVLGHG